jgi:hypothetical protein
MIEVPIFRPLARPECASTLATANVPEDQTAELVTSIRLESL